MLAASSSTRAGGHGGEARSWGHKWDCQVRPEWGKKHPLSKATYVCCCTRRKLGENSLLWGGCVLAWETKVLAFLQPRLVPKTGVGGQLLCLITEWGKLSWGTEGTGLQAPASSLTFPCEDRTISGWSDGCCRTRGLFLGFSNPRHKSCLSGSPRQPPGPPDRRPWASAWFSGHFRALRSGRDK